MKIIKMLQLDDHRWAVTVDGVVRRVFHDEEECRRVREALVVEKYGVPVEEITLPKALGRME